MAYLHFLWGLPILKNWTNYSIYQILQMKCAIMMAKKENSTKGEKKMWGDEYLYQQLEYKHIHRKLKDVTEKDVLEKAVHISQLPVMPVTEKEVQEYNEFRKANYDLQMKRSDGLTKLIILAGLAALAFYSVRITILAILVRNLLLFFVFGFLSIIFVGPLIGLLFSLKKKTHIEKPTGVIYGYLANSFTDIVTKRVGYKPYHTVTEHNPYSDIWFEEEDKFLRKVPQSLKAFRYDGKTYCWSDLVYTPVKVFVFSEYRLEVMPAYAEFEKGEALSIGEKDEQ